MRGRILLGAGLAVGYVLGARAGRDAYERLRRRAGQAARSPQVGRAVNAAVHAAETAAPQLTGAVEGVVGAVTEPSPRTPAAPAPAAPTLREGTRATAPTGEDETATATD